METDAEEDHTAEEAAAQVRSSRWSSRPRNLLAAASTFDAWDSTAG
jgi:hypothetical protein